MSGKNTQLGRLVAVQKVRIEAAEAAWHAARGEYSKCDTAREEAKRLRDVQAEARRRHLLSGPLGSSLSVRDLIHKEQRLGWIDDRLEELSGSLAQADEALTLAMQKQVEAFARLQKARARLEVLELQKQRQQQEKNRKARRKEEGRLDDLVTNGRGERKSRQAEAAREKRNMFSQTRAVGATVERTGSTARLPGERPRVPESVAEQFRRMFDKTAEGQPKQEQLLDGESINDRIADGKATEGGAREKQEYLSKEGPGKAEQENDGRKNITHADHAVVERKGEGRGDENPHDHKSSGKFADERFMSDPSERPEFRTANELALMTQSGMLALHSVNTVANFPPPVRGDVNLSDLLERHVRQMLATESAAKGNLGGQVMLRLSDTSLSGADIVLIRTQRGWSMRASATGNDSLEEIRRAAPKLIAQFSEKGLGLLEVEAVRQS